MGPTELTISGFIALAAALPLAAILETTDSKTVLSTPQAEVRIFENYVIKSDCVGDKGDVGPCVICKITGEQVGVGVEKNAQN